MEALGNKWFLMAFEQGRRVIEMDRDRMRAAALLVLPVMLGGCQHAVWGNAMALCMTFGLFFGTLQLGRKPGEKKSAAPPKATP